MRNKHKKILLLWVIVFGVILFCGCGQIERIHNEISQRDEVKEITFPTYLIELGGYSTEKTKQLIEDENSENTWCNSIYANEDGSLTLVVTETQVENWKKNIETLAAEEKERFAELGIEISISSDFQKLDYSFSNENSFYSFSVSFALARINMIKYQMFSGIDPNEWFIDVTIRDSKNNKTLAEFTIPDEGFSIKTEDFE